MKSKATLIAVFLFIIVILGSNVFSEIEQAHVIVNSKDWRDVYSAVLYAKLDGKPSNFVMSTNYAQYVLNAVPKTSSVLAISSRSNPYIKGYNTLMDTNNYEGEELVLSNVNFDLAELLDENITKFIVVDDTYGYNAISAASYAVVSKSYVLFTNDINIDQVVDFLNNRIVEQVIIFGQVDRAVKEALTVFDPEVINEGDRFDNNLAIVDKYLEYKPTRQLMMSNGEFIEESIMSGDNPVIFIGRNNVPDSVRNYIQKSDFEVAVLIGNELVGPATFIKRQLGISVFVKFAQGSRNPTGTVSAVEDLDKFPMPNYQVELSVPNIRYNIATRQLEVTYQNAKPLALYFKSTVTIRLDDGQDIVLGDEAPIFLDGEELKTVGYELEFNTTPENLIASLYVLFGEAEKSLEYLYQAEREINIVDILDDSEIAVVGVMYDKYRKRFEIEVENLKEVDTYTSAEIVSLYVNEEYKTFSSDKIMYLGPHKKATIYVRTADFIDVDFENNNFITARVFYGQREQSLIKVFEGEYEFLLAKGDYIIYALVIVLAALLVITFIMRKKCPRCGHSNSKNARNCTKCGSML